MIKKLFLSFKNAFNGLRIVLKEERHFKVQLLAGILVLFFMLYFPLSNIERAILLLVIILVLVLELINSKIERILNFINPGFNNDIKKIKDVLASTVLIAIIGSILIAFLIFLPYLS